MSIYHERTKLLILPWELFGKTTGDDEVDKGNGYCVSNDDNSEDDEDIDKVEFVDGVCNGEDNGGVDDVDDNGAGDGGSDADGDDGNGWGNDDVDVGGDSDISDDGSDRDFGSDDVGDIGDDDDGDGGCDDDWDGNDEGDDEGDSDDDGCNNDADGEGDDGGEGDIDGGDEVHDDGNKDDDDDEAVDGDGEGLVSHRSPVIPAGQVHTKVPDPLEQVPPFRHGADEQGSSDKAERHENWLRYEWPIEVVSANKISHFHTIQIPTCITVAIIC